MRLVSVLCHLGKLLVLVMGWFGYNRLYPVFEFLYRGLRFLWRWITVQLRALVGYTSSALGWRKDRRGGRDEPEISEKHSGSTTTSPPAVVEEPDPEVQHEAAVGEGAAACDISWRDEENEDEFDSEKYRVDPADEMYTGYDSTWETERHQESTLINSWRPAASTSYKFSRFQSAARDMQNYRHGYPSQTRLQHWNKPKSDAKPNLTFYLGRAPSLPDGVYIYDFHKEWFGEYEALEYVHTFIQWLFPLPEPGMNYEATPLTNEEIKGFLKSSTAKDNLLRSYKLMLDFYGINLCDERTGEVKRAPNWRDRFNNLNSHTHNNLRITRILKCLGILGYCHYQAPLVHFFLKETLVHGELPNVKDSVLNYFVFAVLDRKKRRNLLKFAFMNYDRKDEFVWCPKKIQMIWLDYQHHSPEGNEWSV